MIGRFAPSPTGHLHLGNARTALLAWLQARAAAGRFLLRIEDLDRARCRPEHVETLLRDLEFLGLDWDEPPIFQSKRDDAYRAALEQLGKQGVLYECFCSRAEIQRAASAPHGAGDDGPRYSSTCRSRSQSERERLSKERPAALRFEPRAGEICFDDEVAGRHCQDVRSVVGDFVVRRNDGVASYQLAVVMDDVFSGVTHVLRGDDLLSSTPRQLLIYEALGTRPPSYAHVPLVVDPEGKRLAKRERALAVTELRTRGVDAKKIVGLLAGWSGLPSPPTTARELVSAFSLARLPREPVRTTEAEVRAALGFA